MKSKKVEYVDEIGYQYNEQFVKAVPICPKCKGKIDRYPLYGNPKFCIECGQKFDWSEEQ